MCGCQSYTSSPNRQTLTALKFAENVIYKSSRLQRYQACRYEQWYIILN